jgi:hypothetical protein
MKEQTENPTSNYWILGVNLLLFLLYTGGIALIDKNDIVGAFFIAVLHFVICIIMALYHRNGAWFLAGMLILVIGFGTCANYVKI